MSHSILKMMLILPLVVAGTSYANSASVDPSEAASYWSDEAAGGGSYLGVDTCDVTAERVGPLQLKEERGVEVTMVDQDAPAGKAGVREHDVILSINGEPVQGVEQLRRMIHEIPPGRSVAIGISRDGQPLTLQAQLARRKDFSVLAPEFKFVMPNLTTLPELDIPASIVVVHSSAHSGLMVETMSPQLSDFFGAKDGQGILVRSVEKGSCAEKAGFHAGDVIVRVNGEAVRDAGDFSQAIRNRKSATVNVGVVREKKERTLTLTLPEPKHSGEFEERFAPPKIGADLNQELEHLKSELADMKPQVDIAKSEMERLKPELEKQAREWSRQQAQTLGEQARELSKQMQQWKEQHPEKQLQEQFRQLTHEWAEI
jgi:serine protease Do